MAGPDPADTGLEWDEVDTGDVFAGAIVTDATSGPSGYVAVGHDADEAARPRIWHSPDGVSWTAVEGSGLPDGLGTGPSGGPRNVPTEAVSDRALVVGADDSGYVLAARRKYGTEPAGEECDAVAFLATSSDGTTWEPAGRVALGFSVRGDGCRLPSQGSPSILTDGHLTGIGVSGDRVTLFGVAMWARAFETGDTSLAVWVGNRGADLQLVTEKSRGFDGVLDMALTADGRPVLGGHGGVSSDTPLVLVGDPDGAFDTTVAGLTIEGRDVDIIAMVGTGSEVIAVGVSDGTFDEPDDPEFVVWRSADGVAWSRDPVEDDGTALRATEIVVGPAGPLAIGRTEGVAPDAVVMRFSDGAWRRAPGDFDDALVDVQRLLSTQWGAIAFIFEGPGSDTRLFATGAVPVA